jgi:serine/threonine-protein kinase HipA
MNGDVYKAGEFAGRLVRHDSHLEFSYSPTYTGLPVASTLPIGDAPFAAPAGQLPAFFTGLLPEGRRLRALQLQLKVSADDELSQLLAVGSDTVGDVQVVPEGQAPTATPSVAQDLPWDEVDLFDLFETSISTQHDAVAIAGAQPKISAKMISFPAPRNSGPVIIKLNPPEYSRITANEFAMINLAAGLGFTVPIHRLVKDHQGTEGLVLNRFDRISTQDRRLAVEDGCQALDRYPADKYNLDTVQVIVKLASLCSAPAVATLQLAERLLFAYLTGDGDLHARNLSVIRSEQGLVTPSPWYDLICTAIYDDWTLANPLNGDTDVREVGRSRFLAATQAMGLPDKAAERMLDDRVPKIATSIATALKALPFTHFPSAPNVARVLSRKAALLL